tara:strand:- start:900 stop:2159 length:1260 start_codon:yes stop_codon:yes gene_type:complete
MSSTTQHTLQAVKPIQNAPQKQNIVVDDAFGLVAAFNHNVTELFQGNGKDNIVIDHSGSISGPNALLLRTSVAALVQGTNVEGKFVIPKPDGLTAIVKAVQHCMPKDGTLFLFTDGEENQFFGKLEVGTEPNGDLKVVEMDFRHGRGDAGVLADHLQHSGVKVCILGIGPGAKSMVTEMLNRSNVFCGHIESGADAKAIVSIVRTLKRVSKGTAGSSVTRNGTQHALLIALNEEVQESIQNLTPAEMAELDDVIGNVPIANSTIACPTDLIRAMDAVFDKYDDDIKKQEKDIKAVLLLAMEEMCNGVRPAALVTSKHTAIVSIPRDDRRHCNRLFSRLAKSEIIMHETVVPEGGVVVTNNGEEYRYSKGCAQYSCSIPKSVIVELSANAVFCTPRNELSAPKKKRKRSGGTDSNKKSKQ